jgi:hypothetical protein
MKLLENRQFKNPNLYQKLIEYADLDEFYSLLPDAASKEANKPPKDDPHGLHGQRELRAYLFPDFGNVDSQRLTDLQKKQYDSVSPSLKNGR